MIPKLGVDTPVEVLGVNAENYLDTPANPLNAGWYGNGLSDVPGWNGNAVFSAHYNQLLGGTWHDAPFRHISTLQQGDEVVVVMADGSVYRYRVLTYTRYEEASFPTGELLDGQGKPADAEWITLITCGGRTSELDANGVGSFLDRDVVIAERIDNKPRSTT
ncbi:MAG: class F sortase [Tepidiformaceae bacterium]